MIDGQNKLHTKPVLDPDRKVDRLLQVFRGRRYLQELHRLYGQVEVVDYHRTTWNLTDIERWRQECYQQIFTPRQREAWSLCVECEFSEGKAAEIMGLKEGSPVMMYVRTGLKKFIETHDELIGWKQ